MQTNNSSYDESKKLSEFVKKALLEHLITVEEWVAEQERTGQKVFLCKQDGDIRLYGTYYRNLQSSRRPYVSDHIMDFIVFVGNSIWSYSSWYEYALNTFNELVSERNKMNGENE